MSGKQDGWFSRKYKTREGLDRYRAEQLQRENDFWDTIEQNKKERAKRSPQQQLALLDERLGKGMGAKKERKRLKAQMNG